MKRKLTHNDLRKFVNRSSKYRNVRTVVDGITFASKREANRYSELKLLQKAGKVVHIERQLPILLHAPGGQAIGKYIPDFCYIDLERNCTIYEDAKGTRTSLYKWKKKHVEAEYGITIVEV